MQHTVPRLRQLNPPLQVQPEPKTTPQQIAALAEQRLDLAFGWTPQVNAGFAALLITRDPVVPVMVARDLRDTGVFLPPPTLC